MMTSDRFTPAPAPVLVLGGTGEARLLAERLGARADLAVTLSLAGRTAQPRLPEGGRMMIRTGGFGGVDGLAAYLRRHGVRVLVDATHPFAARMSAHAVLAARLAGVPLLAVERPPWTARPGDLWIDADGMAGAAAALGEARRTVFLAIGRQEVAAFRHAPQHRYIVRSIEPVPPDALPPDADVVLARGPFAEADEQRLFTAHGVTAVVAKNSGGAATYAKIAAARGLGLPVVMVRRPVPDTAGARPDAVVPDAGAALSVLADLLSHRPSPLIERGE